MLNKQHNSSVKEESIKDPFTAERKYKILMNLKMMYELLNSAQINKCN